jgi:hypothetical protein
VVDYTWSDLEVFLDVVKLDLLKPKKAQGMASSILFVASIGLRDREKFNDCLQQSFPKVAIVEMSHSFEIKTPKLLRRLLVE